MLFSAVQRKYNLSDRQLYYIKERLEKLHKDDNWLIYIYNQYFIKELWIYLEGVEWIRDVYLKQDVPYRLAEIEFAQKQINRLEKELHQHENPIPIKSNMDIHTLSIYFEKSKTYIYAILRDIKRDHHEWIICDKPLVISKEAAVYLEKNVMLDRYIKDLYNYKRCLQRKKMIEIECGKR